jgi:hypothetical protein
MIEKTNIKVNQKLISQAAKCSLPNKVTVLNQKTASFFYDPWEIKPEFKNTFWGEILNSLPYNKGEARLIKLNPGETYMAHSDIDDRWHLNFSGEYSYLIDLDSNIMYTTTSDGFWYLMDTSKIHVASNFGSVDRIQLVVRKLLQTSNKTDLIKVIISPSYQQYDFRYKFDHTWSPWLNLNSKNGNISNFNFNDQTVSFNLCRSLITDLINRSNSNFKIDYE